MVVIERKSKLWKYLSEDLRGLVVTGERLLIECHSLSGKVTDYSYLVFPFSKMYEGFLKSLFLDMKLIYIEDFYGDDIRIGRILNPMFMKESDSAYAKLLTLSKEGRAAAEKLWRIWRRGRNEIFHYWPHNFRKISKEEAIDIIGELVVAMEGAVEILKGSQA